MKAGAASSALRGNSYRDFDLDEFTGRTGSAVPQVKNNFHIGKYCFLTFYVAGARV